MPTHWFAATLLLTLCFVLGCNSKHPPTKQPNNPKASAADVAQELTFSKHIAPIVYSKCLACHHGGGSAPFPLETYKQVSNRAQQIVEVTASGYMPPWLPEQSSHEFAANRSLTPREIERIRRWYERGSVEGLASDLPAKPEFRDGWVLGEPDLIVAMAKPYLHKQSDNDEWRNFVLPLPINELRYVRTYDVRVSNPQAVHHAVIQLDGTGRTRALDARDPQPGFAGMQNGQVRLTGNAPNGQLLGWLPGKSPHAGEDDIGWPVRPQEDLVLQLHMPASGKDELVEVQIGLYFSESKPSKTPMSLLFSFRDIDIQPGDDRYVREMEYTFPVDVTLNGIFPHAHYICEDMLVTAETPDGKVEELIHIPQWDFNWQDEYRYKAPVQISRGTKLHMIYTYNNSASNPQNPFQPPRKIVYGEQSLDAMGDLILQLIPKSNADRANLLADFRRFEIGQSLARHQRRLKADPQNARLHITTGEALLLLGRQQDALQRFAEARRLGDRDARTLAKMAMASKQLKNLEQAIKFQQQAVQAAPRVHALRGELALLLLAAGSLEQAEQQYQTYLNAVPNDPNANSNLGMLMARKGKVAEAERLLLRAIQHNPNLVSAQINLALLERGKGELTRALNRLESVLNIDPENRLARRHLAAIRKAIETK